MGETLQVNRLKSLNNIKSPCITDLNSTPTNLSNNEKKSNPYDSLKYSKTYNVDVDYINNIVQNSQNALKLKYSNYTDTFKKNPSESDQIFDSTTVSNFHLYNNSLSSNNSPNIINTLNNNNNNNNKISNIAEISKTKTCLFSKAKTSIKEKISVTQSIQNYQKCLSSKFKKLNLKTESSKDFSSNEDELIHKDFDSENSDNHASNKKIQSGLIKSKVVLNNTHEKPKISKSTKHNFNHNSLNKMYISTSTKNINEKLITMTNSSKNVNVKLSKSKYASNVKLPLINNLKVNNNIQNVVSKSKFAKLSVDINAYEYVKQKHNY